MLSYKKRRVNIFLMSRSTVSQISHPNNEAEMTQIACRIVESYGGKINSYRLVKLLYIIEHLSWEKFNKPAMGGRYFSMESGPMISEVADAMKPENADNFKIWCEHLKVTDYIKDGEKKATQIESVKPAGRDEISDALLKIIDSVYRQTKSWSNPTLKKYVHDLKEYKEQKKGFCAPIEAEEILSAVGKSPEKIQKLQSESEEWRLFKAALA
jgi:hypothetical protein